MKRILFLLLLSISAFGQIPVTHVATAKLQTKQNAFDLIVSQCDLIQTPFFTTYGRGGAFKETGLTNEARLDKDDILALRGIGNAIPNVPNLLFVGAAPLKSGNPVWNNGLNPNSTLNATYLVNRDNLFAANNQNLFDRWLQFNNSTIGNSNFESNPGSISPTITHPINVIIGLRYTNKVEYETNTFFKDQGPNIRVDVTSGSLDTSTPFDAWQDQVIEFNIDGSGNWQIWKNNVSIATGTGATLSRTELFLGTVSHVMQAHNRFIAYKFGGAFSASAREIIYRNAQICWPWTKPSFPYITNLHQGGFGSFAGNTYTPGNGRTTTFTGGTGVAGTHGYQYFYYDLTDATLFPGGDAPYATSRMVPAVIDITAMATGNNISQISMDGTNLLSSTVTWATSSAATATALAAAVNSGPASSAWFAYVKDATAVQIHKKVFTLAPDVMVVTSSGFTPTTIQIPHGSGFNTSTHNVLGGIFNGNFTNGNIRVSATIWPRDNTGFLGEPIPTDWTAKNF
jgi:hypothetical protein